MSGTAPHNLDEFAALLWAKREQFGLLELTEGLTGYPEIEEILKNSNLTDETKIWLLLLGEWQSYIFCLHYCMYRAERGRNRSWVNSIVSLTYRILTGLSSIFMLSKAGFEIQAYQLARPMSEDIECLSLCILSDDFAKGFVTGNTIDGADSFWNANIARGKLRKKLVAKLATYEDVIPKYQSMTDWRKEEERTFGAFVHPSYISGLIHLYSARSRETDEAGTLPWWREEPIAIAGRPFTFLTSTFADLELAVRFRHRKIIGFARRTLREPKLAEVLRYLSSGPLWLTTLAAANLDADAIGEGLTSDRSAD
jgi:hypothetical protein